MLVNDINSEPLIRVGIVLPEDKRRQIEINIPHGDNNQSKGTIYGNLVIKIDNDGLAVNEKKYHEIMLSPDNSDDYLTIYAVPVGRGFHWEKEVSVKLTGEIHVKNINGYIVLINQLPLENYLPYVVTAEMSPECPPAFIEAQSIAARSWLLANRKENHPDSDFDICNDDCCQRYQGIVEIPENTRQIIRNTKGKVLTYIDEICNARYSKCCGGITESFENVWGGNPIPYLSSVSDGIQVSHKSIKIENHIKKLGDSYCSPNFITNNELIKYLGYVDEKRSYYRWQIVYTYDELKNIFNNKLNININQIIDLIPIERGLSGRIKNLQLIYLNKQNKKSSLEINSEYDIRNALHDKFLYSSAFLIDIERDQDNSLKTLNLNGAGWGHGVGMCQMGALGMAINGYSYKDILDHYFKDSSLFKLY
jgi:SpoIID/LytB domain protein